ncbi:hypothetical protein Amn_35670 [Aminobacter sp. Y103A]|nr:hypothetical protein Amn_35670 [Aminobacter sp. SS-2016]
MVDGVAIVKRNARIAASEAPGDVAEKLLRPVDSAASRALTSAPMNKTLILVVGLRVGKAV